MKFKQWYVVLTRQQFSALLSKSLKFSGIEGGQYKAHSFRIGGATALDFGLMAKYSDTFRKRHIVLPFIFGISIDTPFPAWSVLENLK
jgi:hypothetical protein